MGISGQLSTTIPGIMVMGLTKRYFAIRIGEWVEIRTSSKAPIKECSSIEVKKPIRTTYTDWNGRRRSYLDTPGLTLKCVTYTGGKILQTMKMSKFRVLTQLSIPKDTMIELVGLRKERVKKGIKET